MNPMLTWIRTRLARLLFRTARMVVPAEGGFARVVLTAKSCEFGCGTVGVIVLFEAGEEQICFLATPEDVLRMAKDLRNKAKKAIAYATEKGR
jgi:hypothetical protein